MTLIVAPTNMYRPSYLHAIAITPSDVADIPAPSPGFVEAFVVGTGGTITVVTGGDETVQITAVAGYIYKLRVTRVMATGTAALGIVGLW